MNLSAMAKLISLTLITAILSQQLLWAQPDYTYEVYGGLRPRAAGEAVRGSEEPPRTAVESNRGISAETPRVAEDDYAKISLDFRRGIDAIIAKNRDAIAPELEKRLKNVLACILLGKFEKDKTGAAMQIGVCFKRQGTTETLDRAEAIMSQAEAIFKPVERVGKVSTQIVTRGKPAPIEERFGRPSDFAFDYKEKRYRSVRSTASRDYGEEEKIRQDFAKETRNKIKEFFEWYKARTQTAPPDIGRKMMREPASMEDLRAQAENFAGHEFSADEFFNAMCENFGPVHFLIYDKSGLPRGRAANIVVSNILAGDISPAPQEEKEPEEKPPDLAAIAIIEVGKEYADIVGPGFIAKKEGAFLIFDERVRADPKDSAGDRKAAGVLVPYLWTAVKMKEGIDSEKRKAVLLRLALQMITDMRLRYESVLARKELKWVLDRLHESEDKALLSGI